MENTWSYLAISIALYYLISKTILRKHENLPPSPFPRLPILGHLHLFREPIHRTLAELASRHGPILLLRLGRRRILLISSHTAAEQCLGKNDVVFANRPTVLAGEIFGYNYTTVTFAPYSDHRRNLRRVITGELVSPQRLSLLAETRADEVKILLRRIYRHRSSTVKVRPVLSETANNVMTRMIAGKRYFGECEETEEAKRFRDVIGVVVEKLGEITTLGDFFPVLRWFSARKEKRCRVALKEIDEFVRELVDQRRRKMEEGEGCGVDGRSGDSSMIEVLLSMQKTDPELYTDDIVRGMVFVLLVAGTDTSTAIMEWALALLLNNPTILKKAQNEIDEVVGHHRLITESDLKDLVYLRCIIKETFRMYPVSPFFTRNTSEDCNVNAVEGGYDHHKVPRDSMVMVNVWAIQNDPKVWDEPRKFMPERFYEEVRLNKGRGGKNDYMMIPFGASKRACPGEGLAMRMIGLVLGSMLQCFEWVGEEEEEMVEMAEGVGFTMYRANPLIAKCRPRRQNLVDLFLA